MPQPSPAANPAPPRSWRPAPAATPGVPPLRQCRRSGHGLVREDMHAGSVSSSRRGRIASAARPRSERSTAERTADFITAAIAGYETGAKIGRALDHTRFRALPPPDRLHRPARRRHCRGFKPSDRRRCGSRRGQGPGLRRQHDVRPQSMAARRQRRHVLPSGLRRTQRADQHRAGRSSAPKRPMAHWTAPPACSPPISAARA